MSIAEMQTKSLWGVGGSDLPRCRKDRVRDGKGEDQAEHCRRFHDGSVRIRGFCR
jgi:hypothetical protein